MAKPDDMYVYMVTSNKPLALFLGIGNTPVVTHDSLGYNRIGEQIQKVEAGPQSSAAPMKMQAQLLAEVICTPEGVVISKHYDR